MKKRILIISRVYYPNIINSAEVAIKEITDRIAPEDIEFDMVTLRLDSSLPEFERVGNVNVYRIGLGIKNAQIDDLSRFPLSFNTYLFPFMGFLKARKLHQQYPYSGIWAVMANPAGLVALFFKKSFPSVPYLLTLQEGDSIDSIKENIKRAYALFEQVFTQANFVQPVAQHLAGFAREMGYQGALEVVPNATNVAHFAQNYSEEELFLLKQQLGKQPGDIFLITTSRLVNKNAVDQVIRALPLLDPRVKFLILGVGPDETMLRALAEELKVSSRVKFLRHIDHRDIPKYFKVSDVFVRPSRSEGFGVSFVEAMAAGIPVIATPVGGVPDFLFDAEKDSDREPTGYFCKVDDPQSIATQVTKIFADESLRARVVANAKKLVTEKYDWGLVARDMKEKVFDQFLR